MEFVTKLTLLVVAFLAALHDHIVLSQSPPAMTVTALDELLQDYAFRAFVHPKTGMPYDAQVPSNLTGISIAALRLRTGSLKKRGVKDYKEFNIPTGVIVQPYVQRVILVYQNLGNWSDFFYKMDGFTYLSPVVGLLPYDAANLTAENLPVLNFVASEFPITINFSNVGQAPEGVSVQCVWFDLDGVPQFRDLAAFNSCTTYRRGHFAIVGNYTAPPPAPSPSPGFLPSVPTSSSVPPPGRRTVSPTVWKIVGISVGAAVGLILVGLLGCWVYRFGKDQKMRELEKQADAGEALSMAPVGQTQVPVAHWTRTQPALEHEYTSL